MGDYNQHQDNPTNLDHTNYHTDKAKDKAYMQQQQQQAEQAGEKLQLKGQAVAGTEFFDHKSRTDVLGANFKNYTPNYFALNSSVAERIDNPRRYYAKKGMRHLPFAQTVESDGTRFLSGDNETTNHAIALDNYDFFLRHNEEIRTNLARVMLAKLDLDQNNKQTLNDLLNDKKWAEASGEEIFKELKNRMRKQGLELNARYAPIFKLLSHAEEIDIKWQNYKSKKLKVQEQKYKELLEKHNPFFVIENQEDKERLKQIKSHFVQLASSMEQSDTKTIEQVLQELIDASNAKDASDTARSKGMTANTLYSLLKEERSVLNENAYLFGHKMKEYDKLSNQYRALHDDSIQRATRITENVTLKSKAYPIAILASMTDRDFYEKNISSNAKKAKEEYKELQETFAKEIAKILPSDAGDSKTFMLLLKKNLKKKKPLFEHLYDASKDNFNPQRQYMPFESTTMHDTAGNVLRDSIYLTMLELRDTQTYKTLYDTQSEDALLSISMDSELNKEKPSLDEVIDTHNAISMLEKTTSGEISHKDADMLYSSPLFQDSSVLNKEEVQGLKEFSSTLAETTKTLKSKEIIGTPSEKELRDSIQEMHYLNYSKRILSKMYPNREDTNMLTRTKDFIGRNFFQNNRALHEMNECMKSALNPATNVETIPSMSRNCIEKLKQAYEKEGQDMLQSGGMMKGWFAVSFVGFIHQMIPVVSEAKSDMLNRMIDEMNNKIAQDSLYVNKARTDYERMSRLMNVQGDNNILGNHLVSTSHASDFKDNIEKENIVLTAMRHKEDKKGILVFENLYEKANIPSAQMALEAEEKRIIATLSVQSDRLQTLKNSLLQNASQDKLLQDFMKEIEKLELENKLIEERLKSSHLLTDAETEQYKNSLTKGIKAIETKRDEMYEYAKDAEEYKDISDEINTQEKALEESNRKRIAIAQQKTESTGTLAYHNKKNNRTEVEFNKKHGKDLLLAMATIGAIKKEIDTTLFTKRLKQEDFSKKDEEKLLRDRDKAVIAIEQLQRKILADPILLAEGIAENYRKEYNINLEASDLSRFIDKNGFSEEGINIILSNSSHLPKSERLDIRTKLYDMNIAIKQLQSEGEIDNKYANTISSLVDSISSSEIFMQLKTHNDMYVASENMGDDKSHVRSSKGELGYYIEQLDSISTAIDTEQDDTQKEKLRSFLSSTLNIGESYFQENTADFNEYKEIVAKQAHSSNTLDKANSAINQRSMEFRREI